MGKENDNKEVDNLLFEENDKLYAKFAFLRF